MRAVFYAAPCNIPSTLAGVYFIVFFLAFKISPLVLCLEWQDKGNKLRLINERVGSFSYVYLYGSVGESAVIRVMHFVSVSAPSPFFSPLDLVVSCIDICHHVTVLLKLLILFA